MNKILFSLFALCSLLCTACSDDAQYKADLSQIQRTIDIARDSLSNELWLEVEKNEVIKLCLDSKVRTWETKLHSKKLNDSCLAFQVPTLIGVDTIKVHFPDEEKFHNINLAVGMKYLDFKSEEVLLGFNELRENEINLQWFCMTKKGSVPCGLPPNEDPERLSSVTGSYLVDKYPITNCEIVQVMWDSLGTKNSMRNEEIKMTAEKWINRTIRSIRNQNCITTDTAATSITLFQAMKDANARSL